MEAMELLLGRSSAMLLAAPAPSEEALDKIMRSALRAPDHGRMRPWKFVVIREDKRARLGELMAATLKRANPNATPEMLKRASEAPMRAPMIVMAAYKAKPTEKIPAFEQMISAGAAAQNIMLAAHALGYGAMWKTGDVAYDEEAKKAFGLDPADTIVGFLYLGTRVEPPAPPPARPRPEPKDFVSDWAG